MKRKKQILKSHGKGRDCLEQGYENQDPLTKPQIWPPLFL
jgi:hypothetical protein